MVTRAFAPRDRQRRLLALIDDFPGTRIAVFGDLIVDEFIYGRISRVSREAPVLILEYDSTDIVPGGAGNAANNVAALGGQAVVIGVSGTDHQGTRLVEVLGQAADVSGIVRPAQLTTPTKTRILAGGVHSAKQQVVRIDRASRAPVADADRRAVEITLNTAMSRCDALLVSDYGSGLVDSRYALLEFRGMTACTPNESEVEALLGVRIGDDGKVLEKAGRELLKRTGAEAVLITRGSRGMSLFEPQRATMHIPISGSDQIADVTGAGDTVIATMTLALACGATFEEAARLANYAGGLVVMKRGTAVVTARELKAAVTADPQA